MNDVISNDISLFNLTLILSSYTKTMKEFHKAYKCTNRILISNRLLVSFCFKVLCSGLNENWFEALL